MNYNHSNHDKSNQLEWLFEKRLPSKGQEDDSYEPYYGDVTTLNTNRLILDSVGKNTLRQIAQDAIDLLETSVAIYEINGDYAYGMFSSGWCQLMDTASRKLCNNDDNRIALDCGCWLCHENCWNDSAKASIESGQSTDIQCVGGINLYAEPIYAGKSVVGTINIGYGTPPTDLNRLKELADTFDIDIKKLKEQANSYNPRPLFMVDLTKKRLRTSANLIGEMVEKSILQKKLQENKNFLESTNRMAKVGGWKLDIKTKKVLWTHMTGRIHELPDDFVPTLEEAIKYYHPDDQKTVTDKVSRAIEEGLPYEFETRLITAKGRQRWVRAIGEPKMEGGKCVQLSGTFQDITDRKQAEQELIEKESKFRSYVDNAPDGVFVANEKGEYIEVNKAACEMTGYTEEELLNLSIPDLLYPDDLEKGINSFHELSQKGSTQRELRYLTKTGEKRYWHIDAVKLSDTQFLGFAKDITERKQAEKDLRDSEASLRDAQRIAKIGNWSFDLQTGTVKMSDEMFKLIGLKDKNEALNVTNHEKFYTPESWQRFNQALEAASNKGKSYEIEMEFSDKNAKYRNAIARGEAIYGENNKIVGLKGTLQDITERKQNEKEKIRLEKQLQQSQKMESIGQLAGGIAHDFNNILHPILGFTQMSMDELPENHPVRENLQDVMDGAKRARNLVKRILLFARQKEKKLEPLLIKPVIEETLKLLRSIIPVSIEIESQLYDGDDFILCDETEIHEIVMNLCTNAYHSMDEKGDTIKVVLEKKEPPPEVKLSAGEYLCLSVSDNGTGIKPENLQHIFEPYFTTKEVGKGSGLGLSVVHGIVKSYQGEITVESSPGNGSVFKIFLPVTTQTDIPQPDKEPSDLLMGNEKILFVDDERTIVKLGIRVLEKSGFTVTGVMNGSEALALLKKSPEEYDLIITDMTMPGMVGTELAQKISEINPNVPVLICSGYSEKLDKSKIEIPNIKGYLDKPILAEKMTLKIREILDRKQE